MRRGLVFGKFLPLHRGHQLMIDVALSEVDDLTVVVYDSKVPGDYPPMPVRKRVDWIRQLYPQIENLVVIEDPYRYGDGDSPERAPTYARQLSPLGPFDRVFSSEPEYEHFATLLGAKHVVVDATRDRVPISGTAIRENAWLWRDYMDPIVYASLIQKVVLVGTESTGKSTLAKRLAEDHGTLWVHEYGRELWESQGLQGTFADHLKMASHQVGREAAMVRHADGFLFCDTNAWTTLQWCLRSYGFADERLRRLVDDTVGDYVWVFCDNDFGWVQDGTRELEGIQSAAFQQQQKNDLHERDIPYITVHGTVDERAERVSTMLSSYMLGRRAAAQRVTTI